MVLLLIVTNMCDFLFVGRVQRILQHCLSLYSFLLCIGSNGLGMSQLGEKSMISDL